MRAIALYIHTCFLQENNVVDLLRDTSVGGTLRENVDGMPRVEVLKRASPKWDGPWFHTTIQYSSMIGVCRVFDILRPEREKRNIVRSLLPMFVVIRECSGHPGKESPCFEKTISSK